MILTHGILCRTSFDDSMETNNGYYDKVNALSQRLENFNQKYYKYNLKLHDRQMSNVAIIYNVFADLLAGVITAFILNKLYTYFFGKNTVILAGLLLICTMAGLYNVFRFISSSTSVDHCNNPCQNKRQNNNNSDNS